MSEYPTENQESAAEFDRENALRGVIDQYFPEDQVYFADFMYFEERRDAVIAQLYEYGKDAIAVLREAGVLEEEHEDEI